MPKVKSRNKSQIVDDNNVVNFYQHEDIQEFLPDYPNPNFEKTQVKLPSYSLICASGGSGKTNMLVNLLQRWDNTFSDIYIINQAEEPLYDFLLKKIPKGLTITHKMSDLPTFEELGKSKKTQKLFIFDDMLFVKNSIDYINTLFKRGRKVGATVIFISQSFYDTEKFIRKQIHYLFLLSISGKRDLDAILRTYNFNDVDDRILTRIFKDATKQHLNFLKIDVRNTDINKKFSKNFLEFYKIKEDDSDDE